MHWTLRTIPELADLPRTERRKLWRKCFWSSFRHWQVWAAMFVCGLCAAAGGWIGDQVAMPGMGTIGAALGGGIGGLIFGQVATVYTRRYLSQVRMHRS